MLALCDNSFIDGFCRLLTWGLHQISITDRMLNISWLAAKAKLFSYMNSYILMTVIFFLIPRIACSILELHLSL